VIGGTAWIEKGGDKAQSIDDAHSHIERDMPR
jgi:hypothetical protein